MLRASFRVFFALIVSLSLAFGAFAGIGTSRALAATQPPTAADGYNPVASGPIDIGYCYPSGYNRNGWRCGWRLAQAPYNLGDYYGYYGYYGYGYYGYYNGYNNGYWGNGGTGGYPPANGDYGGRPRFGPYYSCYYNSYYQQYCFYY